MPMPKQVEVVFTQDVEHVAQRGERQVVAGGYWRNFLWPKGLAVLAASQEAKKFLIAQRPQQPTPPVKPATSHKQQKAVRAARDVAKRQKEAQKSARLKEQVATNRQRKET